MTQLVVTTTITGGGYPRRTEPTPSRPTTEPAPQLLTA